MRYAAHEILVAPARPSCHPGRLAAGLLSVLLATFAFSALYWGLCDTLVPGGADMPSLDDTEIGATPTAVVINLVAFVAMIAGLWVALQLLHRRGLAGLIGPMPLVRQQFGITLRALLIFYVATFFIPGPETLETTPNLAFGTWLVFLPLGLLGLLIQVSAEELVFRGYLQSQLAARFSHPVIWIGLPSVGFGLLHYDPAMTGDLVWILILWATLFGVAAADLTARAGTLAPAIALHLINNVSAILIAAPKGSFDGLALYSYPFSLDDADMLWIWMPVDLMMLLCSWLVVRVALRR